MRCCINKNQIENLVKLYFLLFYFCVFDTCHTLLHLSIRCQGRSWVSKKKSAKLKRDNFGSKKLKSGFKFFQFKD